MLNSFYDPLKKSVSILVIDDDPCLLNFYEEIISGHPMYKLTKASTARQAEQIIKSITPIHFCTLDCGIRDIDNDEFYLLKKYSRKIPFIILSGSADMERAFEATTFGAAGMIAKPAEITSPKFWDTLAQTFLNKTILPDLSTAANPFFFQSCEIVRKMSPETVGDWAAKANVTEGYLRRMWSECMAFPPKHVLFLYNIYKSALSYYNSLYLSKINDSETPASQPDQMKHRRLINYYLQNKRVLDAFRDN